jgi:hypothetical protein
MRFLQAAVSGGGGGGGGIGGGSGREEEEAEAIEAPHHLSGEPINSSVLHLRRSSLVELFKLVPCVLRF